MRQKPRGYNRPINPPLVRVYIPLLWRPCINNIKDVRTPDKGSITNIMTSDNFAKEIADIRENVQKNTDTINALATLITRLIQSQEPNRCY